MGKAAIINPYLDTLGGGERYTLIFAKVLSDNGWIVDLEWNDISIKKKLEDRFGLDLSNINVVSDAKRGDNYDLCFWVSDGSIPTLRARKNFLHFQVPFHDINGNSLLNKMKLIRVNKIICNSLFTKKIIDKEYGINSIVVYPPVPVEEIKPKRKENLILSVGRFSQLKQSKRQDVLVSAFKKLIDNGLSGWKLVVAGGIEIGVDDYLKKLEKLAEGYPIEIIKSPHFLDLKNLYGKAKIFWSASGFDEDEGKNPEKVEHFGISVVESMAAGAVPLVFSAGGHREIIQDNVNGFLWDNVHELVRKTKILINDKSLLKKISSESLVDSKQFSNERFKKEFLALL